MAATTAKRIDANTLNLKEQVVSINRVTKVVKGGKNLSFSALVVVGDPGAKIVGFGTGKAKEVPAAIKKGIEAAKKNLRKVHVFSTTILHPVLGQFGSGMVLLKPAPEGTGVIAGGPVRAVIQAVGIPNGLPAPALFIHIGALLMRTEAELVLSSCRAVPRRLLDAGFEFQFPEWPEAADDLAEQWRHRND